MKNIPLLKKFCNILIETSPSNDSNTSGATRYQIDEVMGLEPEILNRYLVRLYNAKLVSEEGEGLVTTQRGLRYLQEYYEMRKRS